VDSQREQLVRFLKDRRARIDPSELGLPAASRRRTPGLRREDVAAVAGVSVTWYTWLEQGREIRVSEQVLEKIAAALRLDADERDYLFMLAQHRPPPPSPLAADDAIAQVSETMHRMIASLGVPAIVMTERWDVLAWNALQTAVFRDYSRLPPTRRNLLKVLLIEEADRLDEDEFDAMARRVVPKFRVDYSQSANPESFDELLQELCSASPTFKKLWECPELATRSVGIHALRHSVLGTLTFEHSSYVPEGSPHLRLIVYSPYGEHTCAAVAKLAATGSRT
jgi:transcriptional regulator with XRE-family HTH domain